jgi:hypothetical protein
MASGYNATFMYFWLTFVHFTLYYNSSLYFVFLWLIPNFVATWTKFWIHGIYSLCMYVLFTCSCRPYLWLDGWRTRDLILLNELPYHDFLPYSILSSWLHTLLSETTFRCFWCSLHYRNRWDTEQLQLFVEQERCTLHYAAGM